MELGTPVGLLFTSIRIGFFFCVIFLAVQIVRSGSSPHVLPLAFFIFLEAYQFDLTRNAASSATQVMVAAAFILGAHFNPDTSDPDLSGLDNLGSITPDLSTPSNQHFMRSV